jgi:hypothetical protein
MDDRLRICLWMVGGGGLGSLLGGAFGGLTGALFAQDGRAAGTGLGRRVADAFTADAEHPLSPIRRGALVGAIDGTVFLGVLGLVGGILLGLSRRATHELLVPAVVGSAILVGGAACFGMLAYAMSSGPRAFGGIILGGLVGAFVAALTLGVNHVLFGVVPGFFVGLLCSHAVGRYAPRFHAPQIGKKLRSPRSDSETDITQPPHLPPDTDLFSRPDSFEEQ